MTTMTETNDDIEDRIAKVECPNCEKMVRAYRTKKGRIVGATTTALALGGIGALVGAGVGLASGGTATAATYHYGGGLAVIGGGYGYLGGSAADDPQCPNCEEKLELGL